MTAPVPPPADQHWPWWPLLPIYPYGRRPTLVRELIPGRIWSFEQLHGVWYVAVPIRMTVVRVEGGLLLYSPIPPTGEVLEALRDLERRHGPVRSIVLATTSGLEHKLPVPAMARAFPSAEVWVTPRQWSFPLSLPSRWLGFPAGRTRFLLEDGVPHPDQLDWHPLGPIDLGLGTFMEMACFDRESGSLLVTDALVAISAEPPPVFELDPNPLLFHARECGSQPLEDSLELRRRGWMRILAFANYLRPIHLEILSLRQTLSEAFSPGCRDRRSHFGLYPFRWLDGWQSQVESLLSRPGQDPVLLIAPVLERLVFPRTKDLFLEWLQSLDACHSLQLLIPAHYDAPVRITTEHLMAFRQNLINRPWACDQGSWHFLAGIDHTLRKLRVVP